MKIDNALLEIWKPRALALLPILNQGELAVLYSFLFLYFVFAGAGAWSVDSIRGGATPRLARSAS